MYVKPATLVLSLPFILAAFTDTYGAVAIEVSVPWLLELVVKHSDDIAKQQNSLSADEATLLSIESKLNPRVGITLSQFENDNERSTGSMLGKNSSQSINMKVSKNFSTGTSISSELQTSFNEQETMLGSPPAKQNNDFEESILSLELRQSLLKNSFGKAYRASRGSAIHAKTAKKNVVADRIEQYLESLVDQYFTVWVAFNNLTSAEERLKREQRRKSIYDRQYKRGFIEKKDILQIDSSILSAQKNVSDSNQKILSLLINLGTIVKIDLYNQYLAKKIRFAFIEEKIKDVQEMCQKNSTDFSSFNSQVYRDRIASFSEKLESIESNGKPDIFFAAKLSSNGIEEEQGGSFSEATSLQHPQYYIAVGIDMIISNSANHAEKLEALKNRSENEILLTQERSKLKSQWLETCNSLRMINDKINLMTKKLKLDSERIILLDRDFRLGKTDLSTLLQAEDVLTSTKSALASLSAQLYNTAWDLRSQSGGLKPYINQALGQ